MPLLIFLIVSLTESEHVLQRAGLLGEASYQETVHFNENAVTNYPARG